MRGSSLIPVRICHRCKCPIWVWFEDNWWSYKGYSHYYCGLIRDEREEEEKNECKLKTCLEKYGGGDNKYECYLNGHIYCYCDHCAKHPTCLRCRLFTETGRYL